LFVCEKEIISNIRYSIFSHKIKVGGEERSGVVEMLEDEEKKADGPKIPEALRQKGRREKDLAFGFGFR
jgi:hypothetical protein